MGILCMPETGVVSDLATGCFILLYLYAEAELLLLLQSLLVGNELFSPLRKHSAFAVDTRAVQASLPFTNV